ARSTAEDGIWGRLLDSAEEVVSAGAARAVLALDFPQTDKDQMNELAAKARAGKLTSEASEEVEAYGRVGSFLGIMKSRARQGLQRAAGKKRAPAPSPHDRGNSLHAEPLADAFS